MAWIEHCECAADLYLFNRNGGFDVGRSAAEVRFFHLETVF